MAPSSWVTVVRLHQAYTKLTSCDRGSYYDGTGIYCLTTAPLKVRF